MEGRNAGCPAIFVRLAGCNLACPWCDTDHSEKMQMTEIDIENELVKYDCYNVVITGGEPLMQDLEQLFLNLSRIGYKVWLETNGTIDTKIPFDHITMSPKGETKLHYWHEAKLIVSKDCSSEILERRIREIEKISIQQIYLQPCWNPKFALETELATQRAVELVKEFPKCRLSLQGHKLIGIR